MTITPEPNTREYIYEISDIKDPGSLEKIYLAIKMESPRDEFETSGSSSPER